jgi:iron complex outermembrane receptor protein
MRGARSKISIGTYMAALLFGMVAAQSANAQEVHAFNVPTQDPVTAIRAFATQADVEIMASAEDLKGKRLNAVTGEIPTEQALSALLAGTGLTYRYVGERTVALVSVHPQAAAAPAAGTVAQPPLPEAPSLVRTASESPAARVGQAPTPVSPEAEGERRGDSTTLQELIVTARRYEENLQSVPISITAMTGEELAQQSVTQVYDLQGQIPGLFMQQARDDPQSLAITMRGRKQEDITLAVDPAVSLNVDGLYIPRTLAMAGALLDINRVEVLRGPQGTLYGRNSTGGAIGLFTNNPTHDLYASADLSAGNFGAWSTTGIANLPITDSIAARFVVQGGAHGGYEHDTAGIPVADARNQYYRAKIGWDGEGGSKAVLTVHYESDHTGIVRGPLSGLVPAGGGSPQGGLLALETQAETGLPLPQAVDLLNQWVASGRSYDIYHNYSAGPPDPGSYGDDTRWDVGLNVTSNLTQDMTFHSITGFQRLSRYAPFGTQFPVDVLIAALDTHDSYVSQEFQLLGNQAGINWVVGFYGGYESGDDDSTVILLPAVLGPAPGINNNQIRNSSGAGFAQAAWEFSPGWRLTAGARYTVDTRQINAVALIGTQCAVPAPGVNTTFFGGAAQCPRTFKNTFRKPTWLTSLDRQLTPDMLLYAKVATGYRSGGQNEGGSVDIETFATFNPETNIEYETGLKSEFLDHKLRVNLDGFWDNYSNLQVQTALLGSSGQFQTVETNAATSTIRGMELEANAILASGLTVRTSTAYTAAHFDRFTDIFGDRSHEPFAVPKWTWSVSGKYVRPVSIGTLLFELDYDWRSSVDLAGHAVYASQVTQGSFGLLNGRINLHLDAQNIDIALFGKNIFNIRYVDQAFTLEGLGFNQEYLGPPGIYGVEVSMKIGKTGN